jgi:hypothetical protein
MPTVVLEVEQEDFSFQAPTNAALSAGKELLATWLRIIYFGDHSVSRTLSFKISCGVLPFRMPS